jgi:hypothetical protein
MMPRTPRSARLRAAVVALTAALLTLAAVLAATSFAAPAGGPVAPAPTGVTGTAGVDSAIVAFTPPPAGAPPVTSYTVTASPGTEQGFGTTSPITVTGLQPNASYTFAVVAASAAGRGPASVPSPPLTTLALPPGTTAPQLSGLTVSFVSFFAVGGAFAGAHTGTSFSYTDSAASIATFTVLRVRDGFEHGGTCILAADGTGKRCTSLALVGTFAHTDVAGGNKVHFSGRLDGHRLSAGLYQIRVTPNLAAVPGNTLKTEVDVF